MIPHARFVFDWVDAGDLYYNVIDPDSTVYKHESTISGKTVKMLGLPVVASAEDEEALVRQANAAYAQMHGIGGAR